MALFDSTSLHVLTRHPHAVKTKGYFAPLTETIWIYYISVAIIIKLIIRISGQTYLQHLKGAHFVTFLSTLMIFTLALFYGQDLRSATIEPYFERLPMALEDIDTRSHHVANLEILPFFSLLNRWNRDRLLTYEFDYEDLLISEAHGVMRRMAESPNYFAVVSRELYFDKILNYKDFILGHGHWPWRLSKKVSSTYFHGVMFPKYQPWNEQLKLKLLMIQVRHFNIIIEHLM